MCSLRDDLCWYKTIYGFQNQLDGSLDHLHERHVLQVQRSVSSWRKDLAWSCVSTFFVVVESCMSLHEPAKQTRKWFATRTSRFFCDSMPYGDVQKGSNYKGASRHYVTLRMGVGRQEVCVTQVVWSASVTLRNGRRRQCNRITGPPSSKLGP